MSRFHSRRCMSGSSLIEVLVAMIILAIGMVGIVMMQVRALKASQSAADRSTAMLLTYSVASALQADRPGAAKGDYNKTVKADTSSSGDSLASSVQADWVKALQNLGDKAELTVSCSGTTTKKCTVTVQWDDSRAAANDAEQKALEKYKLKTEVPI